MPINLAVNFWVQIHLDHSQLLKVSTVKKTKMPKTVLKPKQIHSYINLDLSCLPS